MNFFDMLGNAPNAPTPATVTFISEVVFFAGEYQLPLNASPLEGTVVFQTAGIGAYEIKKNSKNQNVGALKMLSPGDQVPGKSITVEFQYLYSVPCTWWWGQHREGATFEVSSVAMGQIASNPPVGFTSPVHTDFINTTYFKIKKVLDDSVVAGLAAAPDAEKKVITYSGTLPVGECYYWIDPAVKGVNGMTLGREKYLNGQPYTNKFTVPSNMSPTVSNIEVQNVSSTGVDIRAAVTDAESNTINEITVQVALTSDTTWASPIQKVLTAANDIDAFRTNVTATDYYHFSNALSGEYKTRAKGMDSGSGIYGSWVEGPTFNTETVAIDSSSVRESYGSFNYPVTLKQSLNYSPAQDEYITKIDVTYYTTTGHNTANPWTVKIVDDDGTGKPKLTGANSIATPRASTTVSSGLISNVDASPRVATAMFATSANNYANKVLFPAGQKTHIVFEIASGSGTSNYYIWYATTTQTKSELDANVYSGGAWGATVNYDASIKIYKS